MNNDTAECGIPEALVRTLEDLTGQKMPFDEEIPVVVNEILTHPENSLGYSQFNEILLLLGYDRISRPFFQYLVDGTTDLKADASISTMQSLEEGVQRFNIMALLLYGNVKFAFKRLSTDSALLEDELSTMQPLNGDEFRSRHDPIQPIDQIPLNETYLTGYLVQHDLIERLRDDPDNQNLKDLDAKRRSTVLRAEGNHKAYLASDHLDVYVATSMREKHEFITTGKIIRRLEQSSRCADLKLRWFDPTQAVCSSRIDKGLAEALMLKRAQCTIYLAQESDTLGKDSELASTLAQGKPVIAYIPDVTDAYFNEYLGILSEVYSEQEIETTLLDQLKLVDPHTAWNDSNVRQWLDYGAKGHLDALKEVLRSSMRYKYDRRARTLRDSHPLGIQVNLSTGVANGVLVARDADTISELVCDIVLRRLEFTLENGTDATKLVEKRTGSVYRVMTRDKMLTNTFWNFYLDTA